jgi:type II secretion system protein H
MRNAPLPCPLPEGARVPISPLPSGERIEVRGDSPHSELRTPNSKGFTLIELAVVIVVLGIMMALVIPTMGEIGGANLKRSARHLTGTIRFLKDYAEAKKMPYLLRFDVQGGTYWAEDFKRLSDTTGEFRKLQTDISTEGSLFGQTTFRDVQIASHPDDPYILFTPDGWVERALIHLRDGEGRDFTLVVKPLTGDTDLLEGYIEER